MLLLTAIIWGSSFVAQSVGMESIQAFTFNGIRTLIGAVILMAFLLIKSPKFSRELIKKGLILGSVFFIASNLQQFAFYYSTAGKIAFITAFYMFFVPIIGRLLGRKITAVTWFCVFLGLVGLFLLCINPEDLTELNKGDLFALGCSVFYAIHIMLVDKFTQGETDDKLEGVKLSALQFLLSGTISFILMFIFENPQITSIKIATPALLYSGIMSCCLAYTFQILGQKHCEPVTASLLMCLESVFAVISAAIVLKEVPTLTEGIGCTVMFTAIVISQLSEAKQQKD